MKTIEGGDCPRRFKNSRQTLLILADFTLEQFGVFDWKEVTPTRIRSCFRQKRLSSARRAKQESATRRLHAHEETRPEFSTHQEVIKRSDSFAFEEPSTSSNRIDGMETGTEVEAAESIRKRHPNVTQEKWVNV
jgi:hypothetical protein